MRDLLLDNFSIDRPINPGPWPDAGSSDQTSNCEAASHRSKRKRYRQHDVTHGAPTLAVAGQAEGLQAERRYGRVATQKSRHYEQPRIGRRKYRGVISSQGRRNADQEGAANIDGHGAPRERLAQAARHQTRQKVPRDAAQGAADRNTDQPAYHDCEAPKRPRLQTCVIGYRSRLMPFISMGALATPTPTACQTAAISISSASSIVTPVRSAAAMAKWSRTT